MSYERIKYPDGQISVKVGSTSEVIKERINSYEDLFFIKSIAEALTATGWYNHEIFIPCLFGQRSDRRFEANQSFDLKIICDFINSCGFASVTLLDPHSDVALALINNSRKITSQLYVQNTVQDISRLYGGDLILVSPDAGAYKKVFDYGVILNKPVVAAVKHRDLDGKVDLTFMGNVKDKNCLIVDDLCDGGYTFTTLAEKLKKAGANQVFLYVSHGYFSKGFEELKKNISHIFCTNSVKDIDDPFITQYKVI